MILTIAETRKILGDKSSKYSDDELTDIINLLTYIADLVIDHYVLKQKNKH